MPLITLQFDCRRGRAGAAVDAAPVVWCRVQQHRPGGGACARRVAGEARAVVRGIGVRPSRETDQRQGMPAPLPPVHPSVAPTRAVSSRICGNDVSDERVVVLENAGQDGGLLRGQEGNLRYSCAWVVGPRHSRASGNPRQAISQDHFHRAGIHWFDRSWMWQAAIGRFMIPVEFGSNRQYPTKQEHQTR